MTLDEAIIHAKKVYENQSVCEDCREEHKQLAKWLEELKKYKAKERKISTREMFEKLGYGFREIFYDDNSSYAYEYSCGGKRITFQDIDEKGIVTNSVKYISSDELQAIIQQINELGWFGKKQETNIEHFQNVFIEFLAEHIAIVDNKPYLCCETPCNGCVFNLENEECSCFKVKKEWLNQPYKEPTYKLTKFEYDLLRTNDVAKDKTLNDFATYKNLKEIGYFTKLDFDLKIDDILANCEVVG